MKTSQTLIARRYSEALFDVAVEQNKLQEVYDDLQALLAVIKKVPEISQLLDLTSLDGEKKEKLFGELCEPFSMLVQNTLKIVYKNHRMSNLEDIIEIFNHLYDLKQGFIKGNVISAVPLKKEQLEKLENEVARLLGYKQVKLNNSCDASIIGGFIVNVNNQVIDRSLKQRLKKLEQSLLQI